MELSVCVVLDAPSLSLLLVYLSLLDILVLFFIIKINWSILHATSVFAILLLFMVLSSCMV